jgi:hypothetical protein
MEQQQQLCSSERRSTLETAVNLDLGEKKEIRDDDDDSSIVLENSSMIPLEMGRTEDVREASCFSFYVNLEEELLDTSFTDDMDVTTEDSPRAKISFFDSSSIQTDENHDDIFDAIWDGQSHHSSKRSSSVRNHTISVGFVRIIGNGGTMLEC